MQNVPNINAAVHYVSHGTPIRADGTQAYTKQCRAANVTEVSEDEVTVGLFVMNPTGLFFHSLADGGCTYDSGTPGHEDTVLYFNGGTWHWQWDCAEEDDIDISAERAANNTASTES